MKKGEVFRLIVHNDGGPEYFIYQSKSTDEDGVVYANGYWLCNRTYARSWDLYTGAVVEYSSLMDKTMFKKERGLVDMGNIGSFIRGEV